eukprot:75725-Prymnesium_polylepis.1
MVTAYKRPTPHHLQDATSRRRPRPRREASPLLLAAGKPLKLLLDGGARGGLRFGALERWHGQPRAAAARGVVRLERALPVGEHLAERQPAAHPPKWLAGVGPEDGLVVAAHPAR